jgi:hypothetical protein
MLAPMSGKGERFSKFKVPEHAEHAETIKKTPKIDSLVSLIFSACSAFDL